MNRWTEGWTEKRTAMVTTKWACVDGRERKEDRHNSVTAQSRVDKFFREGPDSTYFRHCGCYGLKWVPQNSDVEVLTLSTSECDCIWTWGL